MKMLARAACLLSALFAWAPSMAQHASASAAPAGYAPEEAVVTVPAISPVAGGLTDVAGVVTTTTAVANTGKGSATIAAGVATLGVLSPQLHREIRVVLKGTWVGSFTIGTSPDSCVTINPLTVGGQPWGSFSANANEVVDTPSLAGVAYCATATITSGSLSYSLRQ